MESFMEDLSYLFHDLDDAWDDLYESETLEWLDFFAPGTQKKCFLTLRQEGFKTRIVDLDDDVFCKSEWQVTLILDIIDEALVTAS